MGMHANAYLVYGYNLGGGEDEWHIEEAGEYGEFQAEWYTDGGDDDGDFYEAATRRLLTAAGFTETDWQADGYHDRKTEAEAGIGVEIDTHCSGDYPIYMLVTHRTTAYQGHAQEIDFTALETMRVEQGWDEKLRNALDVLGITPKQTAPRWLLVSYWG